MLPQILFSSYQRYKEDTNVFTTWLSQSARACGYYLSTAESCEAATQKPANPVASTPRLKGRARKLAKLAQDDRGSETDFHVIKHNVTSRTLLEQAETVARSQKKMPKEVLSVVKRSINARKRCSKWFRQSASDDLDSNSSHEQFIEVLEKALKILEPCIDTHTEKRAQSSETPGSAQPPNAGLCNRFGMLNVEDVDETFDVSAASVNMTAKSPSSAPSKDREEYEFEEKLSFALAFIVFCFFEDLHGIEDLLKDSWQQYKEGKLDLETCAMTTNLALDLVRRAEEDLLTKIPGEPIEKGSSYFDMVNLLLFKRPVRPEQGPAPQEVAIPQDMVVPPEKIVPQEEIAPKERSHRETTEGLLEQLGLDPLDHFIYLPTLRILTKFQQSADLSSFFVQTVPLITYSLTSEPWLYDLPHIKEWEDEDTFLTQFLMDQAFEKYIPKVESICQADEYWKVRDETMINGFSIAFCQMKKEKIPSVWIVFAARILLDIRGILKTAIDQTYHSQVEYGDSAIKLLKSYEGKLMALSASLRPKEDENHFRGLYRLLHCRVVQNPIPWMKTRLGESPAKELLKPIKFLSLKNSPSGPRSLFSKELRLIGGIGDKLTDEKIDEADWEEVRSIRPAASSDFLLKHNPLACGTVMFNASLEMEHVGIIIANQHQSIFAISHLYNAVRQTGHLEASWKELDHVIELQIKQLFQGQLPTTPQDMFRRWVIRLGIPSYHFAHDAKLRAPNWKRKNKKYFGPELSETRMTKTLLDFIHSQEANEHGMRKLQLLIQEKQTEAEKRGGKRNGQKQLTPIEVLQQVREWLPRTLETMKTRYIQLTHICNDLLEKIYCRIEETLGMPPLMDGMKDHVVSRNMTMVLGILSETMHCSEGTKKGDKNRSLQLSIGARVLHDFLEQATT
ncbi:uncharacterized protein KY384_003518 [Bacidia gigantensis]|uniref:uncharacterized protein n=1 Tax=Bacidia gigantensis TaxID=2732470 RepID=UPI001D04D6E5|nr:uncharacterized protein KY384_003518 [Bacidia gigantensis]KAG8531882.1 hypothetical protein KY384_003518 [Bacidia gigantensis]